MCWRLTGRDSQQRAGTSGREAIPPALSEEKLGLRFHDLRHTPASLFHEGGQRVSAKAISTRLGHSSITITFDRYGHLFPDAEEELTDALDAAYERATLARAEVVALSRAE
jgi:integrase